MQALIVWSTELAKELTLIGKTNAFTNLSPGREHPKGPY